MPYHGAFVYDCMIKSFVSEQNVEDNNLASESLAEQRKIEYLSKDTEYAVSLLMQRAVQIKVLDLFKHLRLSELMDVAELPAFRLTKQDFVLGALLGKGGFSVVYEATIIPDLLASEKRISSGSSNGGNNNRVLHRSSKYALKCLQPMDPKNLKHSLRGAIDLANEAFLLASLCHENIVSLYSWSIAGIENGSTSKFIGDYFLVLECMDHTLTHQFNLWSIHELQHKSKYSARNELIDLRNMKEHILYFPTLQERLKFARSIGVAMQYLHNHRIMYRDLKPENIGIISNTPKIFDFGLAKEVSCSKDQIIGDRCYVNVENRHTKLTGSLRYMAPEVALGKPYGLLVDVYSFGVLLWQIAALGSLPYDTYSITSPEEFIDQVVVRMVRPNLEVARGCGADNIILSLIKSCWCSQSNERPRMDRVVSMIDFALLSMF